MLFISRLKRPWSCFPSFFLLPSYFHSVVQRVQVSFSLSVWWWSFLYSSEYSGQSHDCCSLDGLDPFSNFKFFMLSFKAFDNYSDKADFMSFYQDSTISSLTGNTIKSVDQFLYLISYTSSSESNFNIREVKAWLAIDRLATIQKSHIYDKKKKIIPSCSRISCIARFHHLEFNETSG